MGNTLLFTNCIFLFLACKNYYNLSHLEKFGIIETAIIKSYSIKSHIEGSGTYYHVKIEYSLLGENLKQICSFDFKPSEEYYENKRIQIIHDSKNDFKLPIAEKEAYKRNEINGNFIRAMGGLFIILLARCVNYIFEKNRNRNKRIKKLIKKKPELKEKYRKEECIKNIIILILLVPFLLIHCLIEWIRERFDSKKRNK
ncbi:hypothetical protein JO41_02590 [Treponema sp. OMZ 838]|nr:hypothetical protein JO41_02590 [Treponema sp. OMZ 838]